MVMVHHEVKGVVETDGKESGRCSSGGEVAFSTGSFCRQNTGQRGAQDTPKQVRYGAWNVVRTRSCGGFDARKDDTYLER